MTAPPRFTPPSPPVLQTAPFLVLVLETSRVSIDVSALTERLAKVCGVERSDEGWEAFARDQRLTIGGRPILAQPTYWFHSESRWFAVATSEAKMEAHVYFGWVGERGRKYTHLNLIRDSRRWLHTLSRSATPWWLCPFWRIPCSGSAFVAGAESGICLRSKQSFLSTIWDKETLATLGTLLVAASAAVTKNGDFSAPILKTASVGVLIATLAYAAIRHLFLLPGSAWGVEGLER